MTYEVLAGGDKLLNARGKLRGLRGDLEALDESTTPAAFAPDPADVVGWRRQLTPSRSTHPRRLGVVFQENGEYKYVVMFMNYSEK